MANQNNKIDKRAMVSEKARIGKGVEIGPYAVIADKAQIGDNCRIDSFAQVLGHTKVGCDTHIFPYAVVGNIPQDLKYKGEKSFLIIGEKNRIREFVTINPGTEKGARTVIGNGNLIMAYSHVAHDCLIGDGNILANGSTLAGYVTIGNRVVIGGLVAVHQFCRLGELSIVGGCSKVVQDIPPYSMCDGHPAVVRGINLIGLRRGKFSVEAIRSLKKAFKIIFFEGYPIDKARELISRDVGATKELSLIFDFIASSKRGISLNKTASKI